MNLFPQLRRDPIVDRWVLIAPERGGRPFDFTEHGDVAQAGSCPFCEGHEFQTPHEVFALRQPETQPDSPGWQIRVVSNMFPAARRDAPPCGGDDLLQAAAGYGVHEVVVESPRHVKSWTELPREQVRSIFRVYQDRLTDLSRDSKVAYAQVFKNHGAAAGASVEHVHSQILGVPLIPREMRAELDAASDHFGKTNRCIYCELIDREIGSGARVIHADDRVVALAAFAGRFPYETWILPRHHHSAYHRANAADLNASADAIGMVLNRLHLRVEGISYNLVLHTSPFHDAPWPDYHWHWKLLPRTTGIAGFELSTGWFINSLPPELAAEHLRG